LSRQDPAHPSLLKYAKAGVILSGKTPKDRTSGCVLLLETLEYWQEFLGFPGLKEFGIGEEDIGRITAVTRSKSNAVNLGEESINRIFESRL